MISDHFECVRTGSGPNDFRLQRNGIQTTDSLSARGQSLSVRGKHLVQDVLLTVPTPAEWAKYFTQRAKVDLGRVWTGEMASALDELDDRTVATVMDGLLAYAKARGDRKRTSQSSSDQTSYAKALAAAVKGNDEASESVSRLEAINAGNRAFWNQQQGLANNSTPRRPT